MTESKSPFGAISTPSRRQLISGVAMTFGGLAAGFGAWGRSQQQTMKENQGSAGNQGRTSLHQEIDRKASPQWICEVLLDSKQFGAFTGMPADIDPKVGGAFATFGGQIVRFEPKAQRSGAKVVLEHTGFPEGGYDHLTEGWSQHYWEPLKKFLA